MTYDFIKREKLYSILMNSGIHKKIVTHIGMCLNGTKSRVRVDKQVSDIFEIHNGLKQGDKLSPLLFNFDKEGVQLNGIHKLLEILKDHMHILRSNTRKLRLDVNINKTKYMVIRRNASCNANGQLMTNKGNFEEVAEFKYLGAFITNRNEIQEEIKHRLNFGNACYYALQRLLSSQLLSKNIKLKICEIWTLTLREERRLRVFENKVLRKIFGPKKNEETGEWRRLHNIELKDLYGKPDIRKIKFHRLRWARHVARMGMKGEILYIDDWKTLAQDRDVWRAYVSTAINFNKGTNKNWEWETIRDTIKLSASESVGLLKKRQTKMNWMRERNEQNSEQLCSIRRETTRFLKNKKREYLKEKINDLEINAKNRNIRELYQGIRIERKGF
ncbi:hypothetical protein C0J52_14417 [Blattella germanica]|nr:hypothetical protein C0J52_14417 [Blattella germanica]